MIEAHDIYCDLQYIVKGEKYIYWSPLEELPQLEDRRPEADIVFYDGKEVTGRTLLKAGMFGFYFPTDGHMPGIAVKERTSMKKIVFKIRYKKSSSIFWTEYFIFMLYCKRVMKRKNICR